MKLTIQEVERFYAIWKQLLFFVNRRLRLVPSMLTISVDEAWEVPDVLKIRDALWADDSHRIAFIAENPAGLSDEDLALVDSWSRRRAGTFTVLRHLKKHTLFLLGSEVFGVLGVFSPLDEVVPFVPCYVKAVLLPFGDRIIYDTLLAPYNITLGPGIRSGLEQTYRDAKERDAIITSLMPAGSASAEDRQKGADSTNAKVLDAFRAHLYRAGLSTKVVERDLANADALAEDLLNRSEPRSLRDIGSADLTGYLARIRASAQAEARKREAVTSLKRLVQFLRDTERLDYDVALYVLDVIKGRE